MIPEKRSEIKINLNNKKRHRDNNESFEEPDLKLVNRKILIIRM